MPNDKTSKPDIKDVETEPDISLLSRLLDKDNMENIILFDEDGEPVELEQIAVIPLDGKLYVILRPIDEDEDVATVFLVSPDDEDSIIAIEDEDLAKKVIDAYNDAK